MGAAGTGNLNQFLNDFLHVDDDTILELVEGTHFDVLNAECRADLPHTRLQIGFFAHIEVSLPQKSLGADILWSEFGAW